MVRLGPAVLGVLVFVLIISVFNWITNSFPGSVGGGLVLIVFLVAAISGLTVSLKATRDF